MQLVEAAKKFNAAVTIVKFKPEYQAGIENLVLPIQQVEFNAGITREEQPDLLNIESTFQTGVGNFWVALSNGSVVGTIGIVDIGDRQVALKKMFVKKEFRGREVGVAQSLMDKVKHWCREHSVQRIYLGTINAMVRAHRFYEKNDFQEVFVNDLPKSFPLVHVDTKFYVCQL